VKFYYLFFKIPLFSNCSISFIVLVLYLWASSNSWLSATRFWRRKKEQLQALAAEPSSQLRPEGGKSLPWLREMQLHPSESSPRTTDTGKFARRPCAQAAVEFLHRKPHGVRRWGFPPPCRSPWAGCPEAKRELLCRGNIAALRRYLCACFALEETVLPGGKLTLSQPKPGHYFNPASR